ncbi:serine/threonine dehydratase [Sphaerisporangium corydalis]|uniref:Serine/threonine dehydratase n=1 Tax=Sphaerisporangium corydalis TaxID=1441875 RepID=A0ABV9E6A8_9ACTN|nr:serine/threonine dehydratase [Sphaerisporangium corydalis]
MVVTRGDVERAAGRIGGRVRRTPLLEGEPGLLMKLEGLQHAGSFKVRGAFNRVLSADAMPRAGVIAASGGNHGMAVAYVAHALGIRAEIFVPEVCAPVKVAGLRALGAHVTQTGAIFADAYEASAKRAAETGALVAHAYDQPEVVAGQGTVGLETLEQAGAAGGVDTIVVAVGGGGLVAGVTAAVAGAVRVVAVEPERIPTLHDALERGGPVEVGVSGVAADALGASRIGRIAYDTVVAGGVRSVLVGDDAIVAARRELWRSYHLAAEHAGAAALAALRCGAYVPEPGERVAVIVCGSNTDPATLGSEDALA